MQRVFATLLLLALAVVPLSAQHRGSGGHVGVRGPSVRVGVRGGYHYGGPHYSLGFGVAVGAHHGGRYYAPHYGRYYSGPRYYYPRYSWGVGFTYGWPYYGSYYPYYSYPYVTYATPPYPAVYSTDSTASQERQQLSNDVNDLRSEVRDLRDSNDQLRYELEKRRMPDEYRYQAQGVPRSQQDTTTAAPRETPLTVLVFKDGKRLETSSYAVVGQTLWVLNQKQARRYPLGMLNVEESRKANAERGVDFDLQNK